MDDPAQSKEAARLQAKLAALGEDAAAAAADDAAAAAERRGSHAAASTSGGPDSQRHSDPNQTLTKP